ncbi:MAG: PKD domain-containing protein, partial [SAR202 cluster bacterium]|nr:PKD domain-containing protein [SAR202 cluster bacterium]
MYTINFVTSDEDAVGPGGLGASGNITLLDIDWDEEATVGGFTSFGGDTKFAGVTIPIPESKFGGEIGGGSSGEAGFELNFEDFDKGTIDVKYPIEATFSVPKKDKFRRGDVITIGSSWRLMPGAALDTTPPTVGKVSLDGKFELHVEAFFEVCVFVCSGRVVVFPFPEPPPGILSALLSILPVDLPEDLEEAELNDILGAIYDLVFAGTVDLGEGTLFTVDLAEPVHLDAEDVATYIVDNPDGIDGPVAEVFASLGAGIAVPDVMFELKKQLILLALPGMADVLGLGDSIDIPSIETIVENAEDNGELALGMMFELIRQLDAIDGGPSRETKIGALTFYLSNFTPFGCCSGTLGLPQVETTSSVDGDGRRLLANGSDEFVDVTIDPLAFLPLPIPLVFSLEVGPSGDCALSFAPFSWLSDCARLNFTIVSQPNNFTLTQNSDFQFDPTPRAKLTFPQPVAYTVSPCVPDNVLDPANPVVCSGTSSVVVYDLGSDIDITVPSGSFHTMDIVPTFLLPHRISNDTVTDFDVNSSFKAGEFGASTPNFEIIPAFTIIPRICVFSLCTPEVRFPGLEVPEINIGPLGPMFEKRFAELHLSDDSLFDQDQPPWTLAGFNTETGGGLPVDAEVKPTAKLAGPNVLDEGQIGAFSGADSVEIDFGEVLTFDWNFGDGISDVGETVSHAYLDNQPGSNPPYTVSMEANDGHVITDTATHNVQVNNVAPTLTVPSTRRTDEGSKIDLSMYPFNRQLLNNPGADQGTSDWSGDVSTATYAAQGTAGPTRAEVLVDNSTPGFYVDLGEDLDGSSDFFPANDSPPEPSITIYNNFDFKTDEGSKTFTGPGAVVLCLTQEDSLYADKLSSFQATNVKSVTLTEHCPPDTDSDFPGQQATYYPAAGSTSVSVKNMGVHDNKMDGIYLEPVDMPASAPPTPSIEIFNNFDFKTDEGTKTFTGSGAVALCMAQSDSTFSDKLSSFKATNVKSVTLTEHCPPATDNRYPGYQVTYYPDAGSTSISVKNMGDHDNRMDGIYLEPVDMPASAPPTPSIEIFNNFDFKTDEGTKTFTGSGAVALCMSESDSTFSDKLSSFKATNVKSVTLTEDCPPDTDRRYPRYQATYYPPEVGVCDRRENREVVFIPPIIGMIFGIPFGMIELPLDFGLPTAEDFEDEGLPPYEFEVMEIEICVESHIELSTSVSVMNMGAQDNKVDGIYLEPISAASPVDPNFPPVTSAPNLSVASGKLGSWLSGARPSGGAWSGGPVSIPSSWPDQHENAIVYEIDAGEGGITDVVAHFAVDDGIWVWVNGNYVYGAIEPGTDTSVFEYANISLPDLSPGMNYIQILRSDAFETSDYKVKITGTTHGGRPAVDTPGSFFRENNYFFGGAGVSSASALQRIDVSAGADLIDEGGEVVGELSGFIGGHSITNDSAIVTATFKDASGAPLPGTIQIGPVSSAERDGVTRMLQRVSTGPVPPGARFVDVTISASRVAGDDADGYIDDLKFMLLAPAGAVVRDVGLGDTHSGTVTWGDGTPLENALVEQEPGIARLLLNHVYVDEVAGGPDGPFGTFTVDVHAEDDDHPTLHNGEDNDSFDVIVANVPPAVSGINTAFAVNDNVTTLVATFEDAGVLDGPWSASINWGDGAVTPGIVDQVNQRVTGTHQYTSPGTGPNFEVLGSVIVTDEDGGSGTGYVTFTVVPLKVPGVHASPDRTVLEGTPLTGLAGGYLPLTPGGPVPEGITYEYMYDFGDGTTYGPVPAPGLEGLSAPAHAYGSNGQFVVTITVLGIADGNIIAAGSDNFVYNILNSTPSVNSIADQTVSEGDMVTAVATFSGPGEADHPSASIDWGDGSPPVPGTVNRVTRTVTGTHVYAEDGAYNVTVTVEDDNGARGSNSFSVTVHNSTPTVT